MVALTFSFEKKTRPFAVCIKSKSIAFMGKPTNSDLLNEGGVYKTLFIALIT